MVLKRGDRGVLVKNLQMDLKTLGYYKGVVDGVFGPMTEEAVRQFQTDKQIKRDGIAGPVTLSLIKQEIEHKKRMPAKKIFIDAGHGGKDPGALGSKSKEKDITLDVALKLRDELLKKGYRVMLSREKDEYVSLAERSKKANDFGADLVLSLHCNAATNKEAAGTETLYKTEASKKIAEKIQAALVKALGTKDRGVVYRDNLYILNAVKMPAVLVEMAFISNEAEEEILLTKQGTIAKTLAKVL